MSLLDLFIPVRVPIKGARRVSENRSERTAENAAYYAANRDRILAYQKEYRARNKVKLLKKAASYYRDHREAILDSRRAKRPVKDLWRAKFYTEIPKADRPCPTCGEPRHVFSTGRVCGYCRPCYLAHQRAINARRKHG